MFYMVKPSPKDAIDSVIDNFYNDSTSCCSRPARLIPKFALLQKHASIHLTAEQQRHEVAILLINVFF
jgi:hypothetical protein